MEENEIKLIHEYIASEQYKKLQSWERPKNNEMLECAKTWARKVNQSNQPVRKAIRETLRYGDMTHIARMSGCSRATISRWLNGESTSASVEMGVMKFWDERKRWDKFVQSVK